jgi:hypothetical protein
MKTVLSVGVLLLAVMGCGLIGRNSTSESTNKATQASPTPKIKVKVADFPSLFGKSVADVKKQVNGKIDYESPSTIKFEIPQGYLNFDTRASVSKEISFRLSDNASGEYLDIYAESPQELADFVGIDLKGKSPNADSSDSFVRYDDLFGGQPVEITFSKEKTSSGKDKFNYLTVRMRQK